MKIVSLIAGVVVLAGCQTAPTVDTDTQPDRCGASSLQHLLGSSAEALDRKTLPESTRIVKPGTMVTRDYREGRLNIHVDDSSVITRIVCG
jgi:uncharacterized lipoprotein YajG